jgi:hypothetical protein
MGVDLGVNNRVAISTGLLTESKIRQDFKKKRAEKSASLQPPGWST